MHADLSNIVNLSACMHVFTKLVVDLDIKSYPCRHSNAYVSQAWVVSRYLYYA